MKLILILKEICYRLGLIADYVVEQGETGEWAWRKWNSGKAECWTKNNGTTRTGSIAASAIMGGYYTYTILTLPFEFIYNTINVQANGQLGTGLGFGFAGVNTSTSIALYIFGNQAESRMTYNVYVTGKWK